MWYRSKTCLLTLLATGALTSACSGSGGFSQAGKGRKPKAEHSSDSRDQDTNRPVVPSPTASSAGGSLDDSNDTADQPVQITGTYLTCDEGDGAGGGKAQGNDASYACRVTQIKTHKTVALGKIAKNWQWTHKAPSGLEAKVVAKPQPPSAPVHIVYEFRASSPAELAALVKGTRLHLDLELKDELVNAGNKKYAFDDTLSATIGRKQDVPSLASTPEFSSVMILTPLLTSGNAPESSPADMPNTQGAGTPSSTPPTDTAHLPPQQNQPESGDSAGKVPLKSSSPIDGPSSHNSSSLVAGPPAVRFSLEPRGAGYQVLAVLDNLPQARLGGDLSELRITGGSDVELLGSEAQSDGSMKVKWRALVKVSVIRAAKTCTAEGFVGSEATVLVTSCP